MKITLEQLHTDGYGAADQLTTAKVQFQAVAVDTGYPDHELLVRTKLQLRFKIVPYKGIRVVYSKFNLKDGTAYYVTAAAEYGHGEYLWVAQQELVTDMADSPVYDVTADLSLKPAEIQKSDAKVFLVTVHDTHPGAEFSFNVKQPLGYEASFLFGSFCCCSSSCCCCSCCCSCCCCCCAALVFVATAVCVVDLYGVALAL